MEFIVNFYDLVDINRRASGIVGYKGYNELITIKYIIIRAFFSRHVY